MIRDPVAILIRLCRWRIPGIVRICAGPKLFGIRPPVTVGIRRIETIRCPIAIGIRRLLVWVVWVAP